LILIALLSNPGIVQDMKRINAYLLTIILLAGCTNHEKANKNANGSLYFDYKISGEEDLDNVTILLQYRKYGSEGEAVSLKAPSQVELDGHPLLPDSAAMSGVFYEIDRPLDEFEGKHVLVFTDENKKKFKEEFVFSRFTIENLPDKVQRGPFVIRLGDLADEDTRLHVVMVDTAFETNDVNQIIHVSKGELPVDAGMLRDLRNGPVSLQIYREDERSLKYPRGMGRILMSYGLKRDFELTD
jgi:hypothetical protein